MRDLQLVQEDKNTLEKDLDTVRNSLQFSVEENTQLQCQLNDARNAAEDLSSRLGLLSAEKMIIEKDLEKVQQERDDILLTCSQLYQRIEISKDQEDSLTKMISGYLPHIKL